MAKKIDKNNMLMKLLGVKIMTLIMCKVHTIVMNSHIIQIKNGAQPDVTENTVEPIAETETIDIIDIR